MAYSNFVKFSLSVFIFISFFTNVKFVKAQSSCQATIDEIAMDIKKKGTTVSITKYPIFLEFLGDYNIKRIGRIDISLNPEESRGRRNNTARDIIYSKVLVSSYINKIFDSCMDVGMIFIGLYRQKEEYYGMMDDNNSLEINFFNGESWITIE